MEIYVPDNPHADLATGQIVPSKSYAYAQSRSDWLLWTYAIDRELKYFDKLQVHSEKMSLERVREKGYHQRPVRSHFIFDSKYDICTGSFLKPKARWVVQGDPNQMLSVIQSYTIYHYNSNDAIQDTKTCASNIASFSPTLSAAISPPIMAAPY